jgi:hypothetical protein
MELFHGTTLENAMKILDAGFKTSKYCNKCPCVNKVMYPDIETCVCCMFGECVSFAKYDKAKDFAKRTSLRHDRGVPGAVIRCLVDMGKMKTVVNVPCACCGTPFVDHRGKWADEYDSFYCPPDSLPAARRPEWGVKNTKRIKILDVYKL